MQRKKITTLLASAILILIAAGCGPQELQYPVQPVNPDASPEAVKLLNYLHSLEGKRTLSGQHNYPHALTASTDSAIAITGKAPAVWGSDFILPMYGSGASYTHQDIVDETIRQHKKGSVITLMYHIVKPFDHDSLGFVHSVKGQVTDEEWEQIVTPGTEYHEMLLAKIDTVAGYLKQLRDLNIPVLWRPYHEMNGIWFWWGDRKGPDGFAKLWKIMYERYVHYHKLNNLIWVWNANAPRDWEDDEAFAYELYYPGDAYVDILAADIYKNDYKTSHHDDLKALAGEKIIAIGECGEIPTPEILVQQPQWTWFMDWANFIWKWNDPEEVRKVYNDPRVMNLEEHKENYKNFGGE